MAMRHFPLILAAGAALFACSEAAKAATITARGDTITITGAIEDGDATRFAQLAGRSIAKVSIGDSPGGNTGESMLIATMIRHGKINTEVSGACASACVTVFAGGYYRSIVGAGRLYVHSAREWTSAAGATAREGAVSYETTIRLARFLYGLGVPTSVLGRLVATPPADLALLGPAELKDWGVQ